jgi:transglutaminase-like putative cysteine protease
MRKRFLVGLLLLLFPAIAGCAHTLLTSPPMDFDQFQDGPIPQEAVTWLEAGEQSALSQAMASIAKKIEGKNRRERLYNAAVFIGKNLPVDRWYNDSSFSRTADELVDRRVLGGCSDFALVQIALFRAQSIPSRMVVTANVDWIHQFRRDRLSMTEGHCFIEVYLEHGWFLFDSTFRWLYSGYDPTRTSYPHGEIFCARGRDFWDMGIRTNEDFDSLLRRLATKFDGVYEDPQYPRLPF